jgi:CheY-like chemotaxis protein
MAAVLLVEDDPSQLNTRRLLLERKGFTVLCASTREEALEQFREAVPESVIMDLRLPKAEDGRALIRKLRAQSKTVRIVVLSGWPEDLTSAPEARLVNDIFSKPIRSEALLRALTRVALFLLVVVLPLAAQTFPFSLARPSEAIAQITLAVPGCDWGIQGREAAVIDLHLDSAPPHQLTLFAGAKPHLYSVFLGPLAAGAHQLRLSRSSLSAPGCPAFEARDAQFKPVDSTDLAALHAPILSARQDTIGRFSDVPMLLYCTRTANVIEYTYIFTNEDGGTNTRDLMARWGRTTDIEFVYRVILNADGSPATALIQAKDHKEIEYAGARLGWHPYLQVATDNNMVEAGSATSVRYQLAPRLADLSRGSRELVMDADPITYAVSAAELQREGKIRPNGPPQDYRIADPRRYLVLEFQSEQQDSLLQGLIELNHSGHWSGSALGIIENFIPRPGWARVAIELPAGASASAVTSLGLQCQVARDRRRLDNPETGRCVIRNIGKVFQLGEDFTPGASIWKKPAPPAGWTLTAGEILTLPLQ